MKHLILDDSTPVRDDNIRNNSLGGDRLRWIVPAIVALGLCALVSLLSEFAVWLGLLVFTVTMVMALLLHRFWYRQEDRRQLAAQTQQAKRLRESEARFRAVTETARDAIITIATDGNIVGWNSAATRLFGFTANEITGQPLTLIIPSRFHGQAMSDFWRLMNGDPERTDGGVTELIGRRKDNSEFLLERSVALWETATGRFYTSTMRDITEHKWREEQTRRLLAENETILRNALVGIVYLKQRRIVSCNRRLEEIFQYDPGELIGQSSEIFYDTHENFLAVGERAYPPLAEQKSYSEELMLRHKNGSLFWGAINGCAIDFSDPHEGSIWIYADISERRRAERQLEEHQAQLEDLVLQRTAELRAALEAANLADRAKDEFLANITHELRTPLSAVIGFSSLARPFCTDARQCDYLDKVNSAGKTLSGIIDDLLDLSKIVAGRMEFEASPFSLRQLVVRSSSVISYKAQEKGLALTEYIAEEVPDILVGDSLRVEQILLNLLSNAVKFTAEGRVELRIDLQAREERRVCLNIEVEDTGIGLRAQEIALLFKPFSQADASMTRKFGGTGLGLAICKRLAELMQGDISVSSREGCGSTFQVKLWLALGEAGDVPGSIERVQESEQVCYRDVRILVVDDQPFNRDVVEGLLAAVGIVPHLVSDGQAALDILSRSNSNSAESFDLVLMDIQMPVMDGLTATRVIRKLDGFSQIPIIAMTAHTMVHERERSVDAGMNDHIGKPFDEAGFYRVLAKWIPLSKKHPLTATVTRPVFTSGLPPLCGVDTRAGLALLLGDETRYRYWLSDFVSGAPAAMRQIRQALAAGEQEVASGAAHSLKGRTGLLGMNEVHASAAALETAIEGAVQTDELLLDLEQGIVAMCAEIQRGLGLAGSARPAVESRRGERRNVPKIERLNGAGDDPANLAGQRPPGLPPASVVQLLARLQAGDGDCDVFAADCLGKLELVENVENSAWVPYLRQALPLIQSFDFDAAGRLLSDDWQAQIQEG